jgi:hypothetical protein
LPSVSREGTTARFSKTGEWEVEMKKVRPYWDSNDLTPEERADRVVKLLGETAVRMARAELEGNIKSDSSQEALSGESPARNKL